MLELPARDAVPPAGPDELREANRRLAEQVSVLRDRLDRHQAELIAARREMAAAQAANRALSERNVRLEEEKGNVAKLYVAASFLHGSLDRAQVIEALHEVLVNLIGSEHFAVYEAEGGATRLVSALLPDGQASAEPSAVAAAALLTGEPYLRPEGDESTPAAAIPLRLEGQTVGVVEVAGLLAHKTGFTPFDEELFSFLAMHAAPALYATRLHALTRAAS
ncbi:GAF domain-containing protein [Longimicrobium sp.]|uniref:GAF domain-containing protein n=1 Tax=Longimicrobium sp. TaxID=2029185 RepID=UPI002ED87F11